MNYPQIPRRIKKSSPDKQFFITIPCKPYVKRFLELNYGNPVHFQADKADYAILRECLSDSRRFDSNYNDFLSTYRHQVTVLLSERDFYRCGWEMSKTNIVRFGLHFENKAKILMRSIIGIYHGLGLPVHVSINKFQDRFYFDENVWPYGSIRKDFYRNGSSHKIDFDNEIFSKVEKIVMTNLSSNGTISQALIKDYENDQKTT